MTKDDTDILQKGAVHLLKRPISNAELEKFKNFFFLLKKWSFVFNLTAIKKDNLIIRQHFLDCLSVIDVLDFYTSDYVFDVGSGAGFPGLVIAIVRPEFQICLIESCRKKSAFLNQVVSELSLTNVRVFNFKVEHLLTKSDFLYSIRKTLYPIVICRGFSSLKNLFHLTSFMPKANCTWIAMKGKYPYKEIEELNSKKLFIKTLKIEVPFLEAARHIIIFKKKM